MVLRIAESARFARSARLKAFLIYVCRATLDQHPEEVSEQKIGERVFHRPHDYNPNEDNIVRSHARLLRQKLEAYFAEEGADEPIVLRIPKGGYVPEFVEREVATVPQPGRAAPVSTRILTGAVLALSIAVTLLAMSVLRMRPVTVAATPTPALASLWSQLLSEKTTTTIVIPDHTYAMLQEASGVREDLASYTRRAAPDSKLQTILPGFPLRRYTTFDGVSTAIRVLQLAEKFPSRVIVRYARDIVLRDLSPGNAILIGRPTTDLWVKLFEPKLNFKVESDLEGHRVICRNISPRPGEQAEYLSKLDGDRFEGYSSVAFLPNLSGGNVLIIGGAVSSSQEGAADFATNERMLESLIEKIAQKGPLPHFDALLKTLTIDGVSQEPSLIAYRVLP